MEGAIQNCLRNYIEQTLCPLLTPGKIIIMDNATFHKSKNTKLLIESKKCTLFYLPPYSPERNPIEHYWAILKRKIKHVRKTVTDLLASVIESLEQTKLFGTP